MIHSFCVTLYAIASLIFATLGSDVLAEQEKHQDDRAKVQAFKEHLGSLKSRPRQNPVTYLVGQIRCQEEKEKDTLSMISVFVDTQNFAYVRLSFLLQPAEVLLTEDNRKKCAELLSKGEEWFCKSKKINASVSESLGHISCQLDIPSILQRGPLKTSSQDAISQQNLELCFRYRKLERDVKKKGIVQFKLGDRIIRRSDQLPLELFFSPQEDCSVGNLISLLRAAPHAAANSLYAEQQLN